MNNSPQEIFVTLLCKVLPQVEEPVVVGLQDKEQRVHPSKKTKNGGLAFECAVQVRENAAGKIDFYGPFVHGTSSARFLYLSWKRTHASAPALWLQRVKVPLAFNADDLADVNALHADITDRRPHDTRPIQWIKKR